MRRRRGRWKGVRVDMRHARVLGPGNPGSGVIKSGLVLIFFEAKNILIFNWPNRFEFFAIREVLHFGAVEAQEKRKIKGRQRERGKRD